LSHEAGIDFITLDHWIFRIYPSENPMT